MRPAQSVEEAKSRYKSGVCAMLPSLALRMQQFSLPLLPKPSFPILYIR